MKKNAGWTLIELLVVLAILGVLVTLAWPEFLQPLAQGEALSRKQIMSEMLTSLQLERSQAVLQGETFNLPIECLAYQTRHEPVLTLHSISMTCFYGPEQQLVIRATGDFGAVSLSALDGFY